jgi:hypothetical protein
MASRQLGNLVESCPAAVQAVDSLSPGTADIWPAAASSAVDIRVHSSELSEVLEVSLRVVG